MERQYPERFSKTSGIKDFIRFWTFISLYISINNYGKNGYNRRKVI
jgi:hypothetical protein